MSPTSSPKPSPRERREIQRQEDERAKERQKARVKAEKKYNRPIRLPHTSSSSWHSGMPARSPRPSITNIYNQQVYGDSVTVHGSDNQVAVGNEGDVQQLSGAGEQDINTRSIEPTTAHLAASALLHQLQIGGIEVDDPHLAADLQADAEALQAEADTEDPDQSKLKIIATAIAGKLTSLTMTGVGGFIAQLLASVFLPPAS